MWSLAPAVWDQSNRRTILLPFKVPTPNTAIKHTKDKNSRAGTAGLAARWPLCPGAREGHGPGLLLEKKAVAVISQRGFLSQKSGRRKKGQRQTIFVLVTFYWHHVHLFTEELGPHPGTQASGRGVLRKQAALQGRRGQLGSAPETWGWGQQGVLT